MPGRVSVEEAVKPFAVARKRENHIAFPAGFGLTLRLLSGLPAFLQRALLQDGALMKIAIIGSGIAG